MIDIRLDTSDFKEGSQSVEIWVNEQRRITISLTDANTSLEMPASRDTVSISRSDGSFYAKHKIR